jgi:hypothetical protein
LTPFDSDHSMIVTSALRAPPQKTLATTAPSNASCWEIINEV